MNKTLTKIVLAGTLAGSSIFGGAGCESINLGQGIFYRSDDSLIKYDDIYFENGWKYIGEVYTNHSTNGANWKMHGKGTLYNEKGKIIRRGYWDMGQEVEEDPLPREKKQTSR